MDMEAESNPGKGLAQEAPSSVPVQDSCKTARECIAVVHLPSGCDCEKTDWKRGPGDSTSEIPVVSNQMNGFECSTQAYKRPDNKSSLA